MGQTEFEIDNEQAKMFARRIFSDIADYINAHRKEFEEFQLTQNQEGSECNENKVTRRRKSL